MKVLYDMSKVGSFDFDDVGSDARGFTSVGMELLHCLMHLHSTTKTNIIVRR